MTLFDRINAILRSRELSLAPTQEVLDDQIVTDPVVPMSQEEEMQARYGVPQDDLDEVQRLKRKIIEQLLANPEDAPGALPQDVKGF